MVLQVGFCEACICMDRARSAHDLGGLLPCVCVWCGFEAWVAELLAWEAAGCQGGCGWRVVAFQGVNFFLYHVEVGSMLCNQAYAFAIANVWSGMHGACSPHMEYQTSNMRSQPHTMCVVSSQPRQRHTLKWQPQATKRACSAQSYILLLSHSNRKNSLQTHSVQNDDDQVRYCCPPYRGPSRREGRHRVCARTADSQAQDCAGRSRHQL